MKAACFILIIQLFILTEGKLCKRTKPSRRTINETLGNAQVVICATINNFKMSSSSETFQSVSVFIRRVFKGKEFLNERREIEIFGLENFEVCPINFLVKDTKILALTVTNDHYHLNAPLLPISLNVLDALHFFVMGFPHKKRRKAKQTFCESSLCPFGSKCVHSSGVCECRSFCRSINSPVCGTDRISYASACHLSVRACILAKKGKTLRVESIGACKKHHPCEDLRCGPGEDCVVTQNKDVLSAQCICPKLCPNYGDSVDSSPVCSSEGVDYHSLCHMKQHACETKTNITVKYFGKCDPCAQMKCGSSTQCKLSEQRRPLCRCSQQCSLQHDPVCADDGNTYSNECVMHVAACKDDLQLSVFKKGKCEDHNNPCSNINCSWGSSCHISKNGTAECRCNKKCELILKPVCGTNGITYDNECELRRLSCEEKSRIEVHHEGTCGTGMCSTFVCRSPQVCAEVGGKPQCVCPQCADHLREVCGSDGHTYPNECKMKRAACLSEKKLFVKYNGICEGCETKECQFYSSCVSDEKGKPECVCPTDCHQDIISRDVKSKTTVVCGTDGVTYSSECHLRKSACQQRKFIVVAFEGKCDACLHVECRYGEECRGGVCICSYNCPVDPPDSARICGENGVLYPSECHLHLASCHKGAPIPEMPLAHCHSAVITSEDTCLCNRVGSFAPTCDETGQCRCRPGVGGLKCDHCLPGFWGIHLIANGAMSCQPCGCSAFGSTRADCEQSTGRCECLRGAVGDKCDKCHDDMVMTAGGCVIKEEYKTPSSCSFLHCHHGARCVSSKTSLPDCICPKNCSSIFLGIATHMAVCGSDGLTYDSYCDLVNFACKHQIDLVAVSLGICEQEIESSEFRDRNLRDKDNSSITIHLGSPCSLSSECVKLNAVCLVNISGRGNCLCGKGTIRQGEKCVIEPTMEVEDSNSLNLHLDGKHGFVAALENLNLFMNITLTINPLSSSGVVLFAKGVYGDDFSLRLDQRRIIADFGDDSLYSHEYLSLSTNHTVQLWWRGRIATLRIGDGATSTKINTKNQKCKTFWIGGENSSTRLFIGTVVKLSVNGHRILKNDLLPLDVRFPSFLPPISFGGNGYFIYPNLKMDVRTIVEVEITLRPVSTDGLVFFWGVVKDGQSAGDFMALFLVAFQPYFFWNLGSGTSYIKGSPLSSHSWSNLRFGRNLRNGTLSIDGVLVGSLISAPKNTHLDISGESVFLGGIPNPDFLPVKLRQLNRTFVGMVRSLSINERLFHLNEKDSHVGKITTYLQKCPTFCGQNSSSSVAHFDGLNDYIYLNRGNESKDSSNSSLFSFEFRPDSNNGIIWWETAWVGIEESDFLIVFLKNGQLNIAINLGSDSTFKSVSVKRKVTLGQWYKLEVNRIRRKTRVILNGELSVTVVSSPGSTELDTNGLVFIGGRGEGKSGIPVKEKFIGCIRNLSISDRFVDIIYDTVSTKEAARCFKDEYDW